LVVVPVQVAVTLLAAAGAQSAWAMDAVATTAGTTQAASKPARDRRVIDHQLGNSQRARRPRLKPGLCGAGGMQGLRSLSISNLA
jgi:hypothetical protein